MLEFTEKHNIKLQCYVQGHLKLLSPSEAYTLFWKAHFGWSLPSDWFRSGFGKNAKQGYMRKLVQKAGRVFGYNLLTRGLLALSINDNSMTDEHDYPPNRNCFHARAARFAKVADGFSFFDYNEEFDGRKNLQPAYRPNPDIQWLIIVGVDPENSYTDAEIDWTLFQNPPKNN